MKNTIFQIRTVCAIAFAALALGACNSGPNGSVLYTVAYDRIAGATKLIITTTDESVEIEEELDGSGTFEGEIEALKSGQYEFVIEVYAQDASEPSGTDTQSLAIFADAEAVLASTVGEIALTISADNTTPHVAQWIDLSASSEPQTDEQLLWTDDCGGTFQSTEDGMKWAKNTEGTCEITVQTSRAPVMATTVTIYVGLKKGTAIRIAGTGTCISNACYGEFHSDGTFHGDCDYDEPKLVPISGGEDADNTQFSHIDMAKLDSQGRVVFVDRFGSRILRINHDGTLTRLVGVAQDPYWEHDSYTGEHIDVDRPHNIDLDDDDNIYFVESWEYYLKKLYANGNTLETLAGNGSSGESFHNGQDGDSAALGRYLTAVGLDSATGDVYVGANYNRETLHKVYAKSNTVDTVQINGIEPWDIEVVGDTIYATERHKQVFSSIKMDGTDYTILAGAPWSSGLSGDNGPATASLMRDPRGLYYDVKTDSFWIADTANDRIRVIDSEGNISSVLPNHGSIASVVIDDDRNLIVSRFDTCSVEKIVGPY